MDMTPLTYTIQEIAALLKAKASVVENQRISWLLTDSRSSFFPEESLFFALKTSRNDGHRYIGDLYKRGIRHFVVSDPAIKPADLPGASLLLVPDTLLALQQFAESADRSRRSSSVSAFSAAVRTMAPIPEGHMSRAMALSDARFSSLRIFLEIPI